MGAIEVELFLVVARRQRSFAARTAECLPCAKSIGGCPRMDPFGLTLHLIDGSGLQRRIGSAPRKQSHRSRSENHFQTELDGEGEDGVGLHKILGLLVVGGIRNVADRRVGVLRY